MSEKTKRIKWIDLVKGVGIILVIFAHTLDINNIYGVALRGVIYSFHMPLFFILSSMTFKFSKNKKEFIEKTKKAAKHLLIPTFVSVAIMIIIRVIKAPHLVSTITFWRENLYTFIFASGSPIVFDECSVMQIGMLWFIVALFVGRTTFDYLQFKFETKKVFAISMLISCVGYIIGASNELILPFSIDVAMTMMPLFYIGSKIKTGNISKTSIKRACVYGAIWAGTLLITFFPHPGKGTYFSAAYRNYPLFPICLVCAACGAIFFCIIGAFLDKKIPDNLLKPIRYIGCNSMWLLIIHNFDSEWMMLWNYDDQLLSIIARISVDIIFFIIFMLIRYLLKKYIIHKKAIVS